MERKVKEIEKLRTDFYSKRKSLITKHKKLKKMLENAVKRKNFLEKKLDLLVTKSLGKVKKNN